MLGELEKPLSATEQSVPEQRNPSLPRATSWRGENAFATAAISSIHPCISSPRLAASSQALEVRGQRQPLQSSHCMMVGSALYASPVYVFSRVITFQSMYL